MSLTLRYRYAIWICSGVSARTSKSNNFISKRILQNRLRAALHNCGTSYKLQIMSSPINTTSRCLVSWRRRIDWSIRQTAKTRFPPYIQLSTIEGGEGAGSSAPAVPRCRTVVFRGFLDEEDKGQVHAMKIVTDARSAKVSQLRANPACEINWWFPGSKEQFRISGHAELHAFNGPPSPIRDAVGAQWRELNDGGRNFLLLQCDPRIWRRLDSR